MADAARYRDDADLIVSLAAAANAGEVRQLADGRFGWMQGGNAGAITNSRTFKTVGQVAIPKTAGIVFLDGCRVYWDRSARAGHYKQVDDQDGLIGTCVGDAASADATMIVNLNVQQRRKVDLLSMPFATTIIGTQALGGLGICNRGGLNFKLDATNEAQKLDALSKDGFANGANGIVEMAFNVISDGAGTVVDFSLGIANASHATDGDAITRHLFVHLDANATAIKLQSKDGTTTVAATDSTKTYTEGSGNANRKAVWFDMRNPADVQVYIDAVNVLTATVFDLSAMATTWYLLAHLEKSAAADTYEIDVEECFVRTAEQ